MADPGFRNAGSKDEALEATRSSDVGAKMEAPRAPRCPLLHAPSPEFLKKILDLKMATLGVYVHSGTIFYSSAIWLVNAQTYW